MPHLARLSIPRLFLDREFVQLKLHGFADLVSRHLEHAFIFARFITTKQFPAAWSPLKAGSPR